MKVLIVFLKSCHEMLRDWWMLGLTLAFAPFFVYLYWLFTHGGSTSYSVLVINHDLGAVSPSGQMVRAGEDVIAAINQVTYADGSPLLKAIVGDSRSQAERILKDRKAAAFIIIPDDFSASLIEADSMGQDASTTVVFGGDLTNPYYMVAATLSITAIEDTILAVTGRSPPVEYVEEPLGASAARTEFEVYVPGILIVAAILLVFLSSMVVAREVESGTLQRLRITAMSSFDFLGGVTLALMLVGVISVLLAFWTAHALGFRSQGPVWVAVLAGALTSLAVIGIGLIVACFSKTVSQAFVISNFPLGVLMFLSGAIFPLPKVVLFSVAGYEFGMYDFLPPTHAVAALNKVLTLGAGFRDVIFEICALLMLSILYFAVGVWLFQRQQMR